MKVEESEKRKKIKKHRKIATFMRNRSLIGLIFSIGLEFHVPKVLLKFHYIRINHVGVIEQRIFEKIEKNRKMAIFMRIFFSIEPKS